MKIAQVASEVVPFAKTGGLADVAGVLPLALKELGEDVIIVMPGYKVIKDAKFAVERFKEGISYSIIGKNIKVYFIENDKYFNRDGLYGDKNGDYKDNLDRFSYFCKRTLELLKEINFSPDIIHCHDWQAAFIPVYLEALYKDDPFYKNTRTVFTIHNIGYQGLFPAEEFPKLGLERSFFNMEMLEFYGKINTLKGGIVFSDIINTVSPTYSREIQTKEFGFGLEGVLGKRKTDLFGILNGLDYSAWNPQNDKFIIKNYSAQNLEDKYKNKEELQKVCNFCLKKDVALFGIVSRLAAQKGFDILAEAIPSICKMNLQLVILGTGESKYHSLLEGIVKKHPKVVSLYLKFDNSLAHKIYAGSDIFLMPSRYEPCGLGQMISLKYGTIPLVFKTGGLADTINVNNGFVFSNYKKEDLIKTMDNAIQRFKDKKKWLELLKGAMRYNFSWQESAKKYLQLYEQARAK
ncbi:MAG: glycogen synthase GlgA [Candidatus Omnitrophica bacterium]|nr:glycogen synthase GlgA [Candidatus Omnitrophota bacterium]MBU4473404.1 glycogen synthase GlgA [Candidatus Omnitrophota bacterium]MCG2706957.1 glycogen synthase GlgA [Candidatus Omnitrophota bacterium]